jgi:uroporphyrinogen-III synthase
MNAVDAVTRHLASLTANPWQVFCIGAATHRLIRDHFGEDRIAGTANSASELANVIIQWKALAAGAPGSHTSEVFFFCGDQRRDELPDQLRQASIKVNELVVYRTLPTPHTIETVYDGIVFFSPSAVHSFFTRNTLPPATILFAIGQTTADCIRGYTPNKTILSDIPEKETLIRQVIGYFQTNNIYY